MTFHSLQPSASWTVHSATQASGPSSNAKILSSMMRKDRKSLASSGRISHQDEMKRTKLTSKRESIASIRIVASRMWPMWRPTERTPIRCCGAQVRRTERAEVKLPRKTSPKCLRRGGKVGSLRVTPRQLNRLKPFTTRSQLLIRRKVTTSQILPGKEIGAKCYSRT